MNKRWHRDVNIFCTEKMIDLRSPVLFQRAFKKEFKARETPNRNTIVRWVKQFMCLGTVDTLNASFIDDPTTVESLGSGQRRLLPSSKIQLKTAQDAVFGIGLSV